MGKNGLKAYFYMLSTIIEKMFMKLKLMQYKSIKSVIVEVSPCSYKMEAKKHQAHFQGMWLFQTYINRLKRAGKGQEEGLTFMFKQPLRLYLCESLLSILTC